MKITRYLLAMLVAGLAAGIASTASAAERASVQAILIVASKEPGKTDSRLSAYESNLRRILRFESFRHAGEGTATIDVPGEGRISLGRGQSVSLAAESADERTTRIKVRWMSIDTGLALRPGVPAILGGPQTGEGDDVYALLLIAR